jgi:hypothetical protein
MTDTTTDIDLPYIKDDHDLTRRVCPFWIAAGIPYECYSSGGGGDMHRILDASRYQEAKEIARIGQRELEKFYAEQEGRIGPDLIVDVEDTESAYIAVAKWDHAGISWHLWAQSAHEGGQAFFFDTVAARDAAAKLIEPVTLSEEELADFDAVRARLMTQRPGAGPNRPQTGCAKSSTESKPGVMLAPPNRRRKDDHA